MSELNEHTGTELAVQAAVEATEQTVHAAAPPSKRMPYESFLAERRCIVEARQRSQQRFDQMVSAGSAGALVFSITFIEKLAPNPPGSTQAILVAAWGSLLIALGMNFVSHLFSQRAFDNYLRAFDAAYTHGTPCNHQSAASVTSRFFDAGSAGAFVAGVLLLAWFSLSNLNFTGPDADRTVQQAGTASATPAAASRASATTDPSATAGPSATPESDPPRP